jgi:uncharacterized protein
MLADVIKLAALLLACSAQAQVPPSAAEAARYTGLHAAAHAGNTGAIEKLAASGADLNRRDGLGRTPLALARSRGYREMVLMLEKAGAR